MLNTDIAVATTLLVTTLTLQSSFFVHAAFHYHPKIITTRNDSSRERRVVIVPLYQQSLSTRRSTTTTTLAEHTLNDDTTTDYFMEEDGPKSQLFNEISITSDGSTTTTTALTNNKNDNDNESRSIRFGFRDSEATKSNIKNLVTDLSGYVLPLDNRKTSHWTLLYTTAPDLFGFQGGPFRQLRGIQQTIRPDTNTIELKLEYQPSTVIVNLLRSFLNDIQDDRLTQTVHFDYTIGSMNTVDLKLQGTRLEASRFIGVGSGGSIGDIGGNGGDGGDGNNNNNKNLLTLPTPLPFIGFTMVFNDGDLRIDRTIQGDFLLIYQKSRG